MMKPRNLTLSLAAALVALTNSAALAEEAGPMGVYQHADGQTYFSLSLSADPQSQVDGRNIVVLFDTSASQTGMYRETAMAALEGLLGSLGPEDRVQLFAADLDARPMNNRFSPADSADLAAGVEKLHAVAPLGSTDLQEALTTAADLLKTSGAENRVVLYIGDGVSAANLLQGPTFARLTDKLREDRVSVSSYAIGPKRDAELLAAIANQSGGNLFVDGPMEWADDAAGVTADRATAENERRGAQAGRTLAAWAKGNVVWPTATTVSESIEAIYPAKLPPLRSDRDSIVIGRLTDGAEAVSIESTADGQPLVWSSGVAAPNESNAYLAALVERAQGDAGVSLPTLGTAGLDEVGRMLNVSVDNLADIAEQAIAAGDRQGAASIAEAVLRRDPGNLRAQTVQRVVVSQQPKNTPQPPQQAAGDLKMTRVAQAELVPAPGDPIIVEESGPTVYEEYEQAPGQIIFEESDYPPAATVADDSLLSAVEQQNRVMAKQLEKEVQVALSEARDIMSNSPQEAIQDLKLMMQSIENAPELLADVRASLMDRLESALRQASRAAAIKDDLDRQREEAVAAGRERRLLLDRMAQDREREKQLMDRFNALMDEGQYAMAEEVAQFVYEVDPNGVTPVAADMWASLSRYHHHNQTIRDRRAKMWLETMALVEESAIPFPDEPPIVYPDAEFWREITNRRKTYDSVSITGDSASERRIAEALSSPLSTSGLDFVEAPLEEVVDFLRTEYGIEIQLDQNALDDLGIGSDEPVTVSLRNISLRSAMRIMLKQLELTYIIADEVLLITTEEEAETRLTTKVYSVGDLVIDKTPLQTFGGQGGGQQGGIGGQQGGGFGGGGGQQGGFGGGGGGQFSVPEDLVLTKRPADNASAAAASGGPVSAAPVSTQQPQSPAKAARPARKTASIQIDESIPADRFWDQYFSSTEPDAAAVRAASRRLMKKGRHDQVIALVQSALRHGQPQPWMYEALGITMQLSGASPQEVERAIMSAADFSSTPEELMLVSHYLIKLDLDRRAIQVLQQVVKLDPQRHEAYLLGLKAAERIDSLDGLQWASAGILSRAWPAEQAGVEKTAARVARSVLRRLEKEGQMSEHAAFSAQLAEAAQRDCVIRVTWTGDADIDLMVEEPDGSVCSLSQPRTPGGGVMLGDAYASEDGPGTTGFSETYICPRGFSGDYQARVRRVWGDVTAGTVTVDVYTGYGGPDQKHQRGQIALGKGDSAVRFALAEGRRTERLDEQQLANAINRQQAIGRAVLAQQLGSLSDPRVNTLRPDDQERIRQRQLAGLRGGAVGYQPVITVLPSGTQFSVNAVTTADRRYVIIRPSPVISDVTDITTFTFAGAATNAGGGGNGDGGGGDGGGDGGGVDLGRRGINAGGGDANNANGF